VQRMYGSATAMIYSLKCEFKLISKMSCVILRYNDEIVVKTI